MFLTYFEHNLISIFADSKQLSNLNYSLSNEDDFPLIADWCLLNNINLVVVGPEVPLVNGIVDTLEKKGSNSFYFLPVKLEVNIHQN